MTNDYAALVAMLDQAAADLQAEIDAAIDRHGLLARTANQLRAEADGPNVIQLDGRAQTIDGPVMTVADFTPFRVRP